MAGGGEEALLGSVLASLAESVDFPADRLSFALHDVGQSDYAASIRLCLGDSALLKVFVPRNAGEPLDVFLSARKASEAKALSSELKTELNRRLGPHKTLHGLPDCLREAQRWWAESGEAGMREALKPLWPKKKEARKGRKAPPRAAEATAEVADGLKSSQDVVSRILWDRDLPAEHFSIGYVDRFVGVVEKPFQALRWERFSEVDPEESAVPRHRIVWFKFRDTLVWDRESKLDLLFGSGLPPKTGPRDIRELLTEDDKDHDDDDDDFQESLLSEDLPSSSQSNPLAELETDQEAPDVPARVRPDFYLSIPVRSEALVSKLSSVQASLAEFHPEAVKRLVPTDQLHLTLALFALPDLGPKGVQSVVDALQRSAEGLSRAVEQMGPLELTGLKLLDQYKVVVSEPANLEPLWREVKKVLREGGVKFYAPSRAHLTLCRLARDKAGYEALNGLCDVSRFQGQEPLVRLSLKELGQQDRATERLPQGFPSTTRPLTQPDACLPEGPDQLTERSTEAGLYLPEASEKLIGFHLRSEEWGSLSDAVRRASAVGARSLAFFFGDKRGRDLAEPLTEDQVKDFKAACDLAGMDPAAFMPHGPYSLNLASDFPDTRRKILDELERCSRLGIRFYNVHLGQLAKGLDYEAEKGGALARVVECIDQICEASSGLDVQLVLETGAGGGSELGRSLEELACVLDGVADKRRLGVCVDTCHVFSAGYDIRSRSGWTRFLEDFDDLIGLEHLAAFHLNDSKEGLGSRKDRHEKIGQGRIGEEAFRRIIRDPVTSGKPLILETPYTKDDHLAELRSLHSFASAPQSLSEQMEAFHRLRRMTRAGLERKEAVREKLEALLKSLNPQAQLLTIGGSASGLGARDSDLDLCLLSNSTASRWGDLMALLKAAQKLLAHSGLPVEDSDVRPGIVPVLRFRFAELRVDVSADQEYSVRDARLLRAYAELSPTFVRLAGVVKAWAQSRGFADAQSGFPNGYTWHLLVLHFAHSRGLPCLMSSQPAAFGLSVPLDKMRAAPVGEDPLGEEPGPLLVELFHFYAATFDWSGSYVSVRTGAALEREAGREEAALAFVEDPYEGRNVARCLRDPQRLRQLRDAMARAKETLTLTNDLQCIFE